MDIDLPTLCLPPKVLHEYDPILNMDSLRAVNFFYLVSMPRTLVICITCQHGHNSKLALSYVMTEHEIVLDKIQKKSILDILNNLSIIQEPGNIDLPKYSCPSIDGLVQQWGFKCKLCSYAATVEPTIKNHLSTAHKTTKGKGTAKSKTEQYVVIQALSVQCPKYSQVSPLFCLLEGPCSWDQHTSAHQPPYRSSCGMSI